MKLPAYRFFRQSAWLLFGILVIAFSCNPERAPESAEFRDARALSLEWNRLLVDLEQYTPGYRAPITASMLAYTGCAAWEAARPGLKGCVSIQNYCPGYFQYSRAPTVFYIPASLNAAYAEIIRQFFPTAPPHLLEKIQLLEAEQARALRRQTDSETYRKSANYGKRVAVAVWRWAATDTIGRDAFLYNYDRKYVPPECPGCWQPGGSHPMPALLPDWGRVRTFVVQPGVLEIKPPAQYDEHSNSAYYAEAMEVFTMSQPLSKENHWIAELWSDDVPGFTVTPAGRWLAITNQAVEKADVSLPEMLELYLKLGLGLNDAMAVCWEAKYRFNRERPEAYINRTIQADWKPLHDNPSFPGYPSGHSALGAVAAALLTELFGENIDFTDRTHNSRKEFVGKARKYRSFDEMAYENAVSRVALGVHFRMDCEEGLRLGRIIGRRVASLPLYNDKAVLAR